GCRPAAGRGGARPRSWAPPGSCLPPVVRAFHFSAWVSRPVSLSDNPALGEFHRSPPSGFAPPPQRWGRLESLPPPGRAALDGLAYNVAPAPWPTAWAP